MIKKLITTTLIITLLFTCLFAQVKSDSKNKKETTMERPALSINPILEADGSYSPSEQALALATSDYTDYENIAYDKYKGDKTKILVIFTEHKNMIMQNGKMFSTGNHPVKALLPMLHLRNAGFDFEIATPTGMPVAFEMWAMPKKDENVTEIYNTYKAQFEKPKSLQKFVDNSLNTLPTYGAVFIPGGHGAMIGIPQNQNVGKVLQSAHENNIFTITLCHGPGSLLATALDGSEFLYKGYK